MTNLHNWLDKHAPEISKEIRETIVLIDRVYHHDETGGNLHAILDDWNLDDDQFMQFRANSLVGASEQQEAAEWQCWQAMEQMDSRERADALNLYYDYRGWG